MTFHWPQIAILSLLGFSLIVSLLDKSKSKSVFVAEFFVTGLFAYCLYAGGFFLGLSP